MPQEINRVLTAAAWRLGFTNFIRGLVYFGAVIVAGLIITRVVQQMFSLAFPWQVIAYSCAGAAVLGGLVWAVVVRPSKAAVARRVDEGANLKESLSTALSIERQQDDPWARVTVESAIRQARGVRVGQAVPIHAPRFWPVPFALGLALVIVWMAVPKMDVLGWKARQVAQEKQRAEATIIKAAEIDIKKFEDQTEKQFGLDKEKMEAPNLEKPEPRTPEEKKRQMLKDLTKISEQLDQLRNGEKGQKLDAVKETLKKLESSGEQTSELTKAMANSNFQAAQKEVEKMKEQMGAASLSDEQKKQLADQLENLSKQLSEMAKNKEQMEQALKNAGLDPKNAQDQKAMEKALEAAKNLTPEQKKQLQEMAQAMSQCQNSMDGLSKACNQMSNACKNGDKAGMQQAAGQMGQQLNQLEQLQQEMQLADAAKNECQGQMAKLGQCDKQGDGQCNKPGDCNGQGQCNSNGPNQQWNASWKDGVGNRRGGGGLGRGGSATSEQAGFDKVTRKDMGLKGDGPIVSSRMVEGESIKGESHAEFVATVTKAEQASTEDMETNVIPREYHNAIKNYFGSLKQKAGAKDAGDSKPADAAPAAPPKPAESAKDAGK